MFNLPISNQQPRSSEIFTGAKECTKDQKVLEQKLQKVCQETLSEIPSPSAPPPSSVDFSPNAEIWIVAFERKSDMEEILWLNALACRSDLEQWLVAFDQKEKVFLNQLENFLKPFSEKRVKHVIHQYLGGIESTLSNCHGEVKADIQNKFPKQPNDLFFKKKGRFIRKEVDRLHRDLCESTEEFIKELKNLRLDRYLPEILSPQLMHLVQKYGTVDETLNQMIKDFIKDLLPQKTLSDQDWEKIRKATIARFPREGMQRVRPSAPDFDEPPSYEQVAT